jgi:hypothetical protein
LTFLVRFCVKACPEAERIGNKNEQEEIWIKRSEIALKLVSSVYNSCGKLKILNKLDGIIQ